MKLLCLSWFRRPKEEEEQDGDPETLTRRDDNTSSENARTEQEKEIEMRELGLTPQASSQSSQHGISVVAANGLSSEKLRIIVSKPSNTELQPPPDERLASETSLLAVPRSQRRLPTPRTQHPIPKPLQGSVSRLDLSSGSVPGQQALQNDITGPNVSQSSTNDVSTRRRDSASTNELQELLTKYRKIMLHGYSSPSGVHELDKNNDNYIALRKLREIFSEVELDGFLSRFKWYNKNLLQRLHNDYLCIIATLIDIGWDRWEQFYDLFLRSRATPAIPKEQQRNDMSLPFGFEELRFLKDFTVQKAFFPSQFKFRHEVFKQNVDYPDELPFETRLPFKSKTPVLRSDMDGTSNSRPIFKVEVDKFGIEINNATCIDKDKPLVAMKVFTHKSEFDQENSAQRKIKDHVSYHDHIVTSLTSFSYRGNSCILYPWADCDLHSLCFGLFSGFTFMAEGSFRPRLIVEQLRGIAQGLSDLHVKYELRHYDLKLENLFAFLPKLDSMTGSTLVNSGIGLWKIGDFGLAKVRGLKSKGKQPEPTGIQAERSGNSAPRNEGTYQAPEMHDGNEVNRNSDSYSLGCVLAVFLAFILGGPVKVIDFHGKRRHGYSSDQFFSTSPDGTYAIKVEVFDFMWSLASPDAGTSPIWIRTFVECILDLIAIDPDERISAAEAAGRLGVVLDQMPECGQLWKHAVPVYASPPISQFDLTSQAPPGSYAERNSPATRPSRTGRTIDQIESTISATGKKFRAAVRWSLHGARAAQQIPYFPPPRCDGQSLFTRLDVMPGVFDIAISPRWIAFVAHDLTLVFNLERVASEHRIWEKAPLTHERAANKELVPVALGIECFEDSYGVRDRRFRSVRVAGHFIALLRESKANPDDWVLEIKRLEWFEDGEKSQVLCRSLTYRNVSAECKDLVLSAQGAVAFVYDDRVQLLFKANYDGEPSRGGKPRKIAEISFAGTIQGAAFSDDGSFLCVWCAAERQLWYIYNIDNDKGTLSRDRYASEDGWRWAHLTSQQKQRQQQQQQQQQSDRSESQRALIVPAFEGNNQIPYFYALDEDRQIWLITPEGNQMIEPSQKYCAGGPFAASLPRNGILVLDPVPDAVDVNVAAGIPGSDIQHQPYIETMSEWKQYRPASTTDIKGLTRLSLTGHEAFVVAHSDGGLALHFFT